MKLAQTLKWTRNHPQIMPQFRLFLLALVVVLSGCMIPPPQWNAVSDAAEAEYQPYLAGGTGSVTGQAFLTQRGGGVVKAAGRTVTLDPATSVGNEWWGKAGKIWVHHSLTPPSTGFSKARRTTIADADGKFKLSALAAGSIRPHERHMGGWRLRADTGRVGRCACRGSRRSDH